MLRPKFRNTKRFFAQHADRLTVFQLPGYSLDYNPVEKLWKKLKEQETHRITFRLSKH